MFKLSICLVIPAVMLCATCTGIAETFDCVNTEGYFDRTYGDPYERRYRRDIFVELQREKEDRQMAELIKKFPIDDPLRANLQKRMDTIISTNFTANTNVAPMEIVPGLSGTP
ncbi:MAG: hypothetical protein WC334_01960 [Kiritimatiellales bacterium]|jgi:transcriptional regulator GlxA family with amidase domain